MEKKLEFWIYSLYRKEFQENWNKIDNNGNPVIEVVDVLVDERVINCPSHNLCIGAVGIDGKYYQFDSYEAYYASHWFAEKESIHGLRIEAVKVSVDRNNLIIL